MRSLFAALIHNSISVAVRGTGSVTDSEVIQALYLLPRCWRDYTSLAAARVYENTRHLMSYLLGYSSTNLPLQTQIELKYSFHRSGLWGLISRPYILMNELGKKTVTSISTLRVAIVTGVFMHSSVAIFVCT